jgi:5'-methylthioadenosine phosphorylase
MTGMPEAALAREASLSYATLAVVANWAAGRASSRNGIAVADIDSVLDAAMARVARILTHLEVPDGGETRT